MNQKQNVESLTVRSEELERVLSQLAQQRRTIIAASIVGEEKYELLIKRRTKRHNASAVAPRARGCVGKERE